MLSETRLLNHIVVYDFYLCKQCPLIMLERSLCLNGHVPIKILNLNCTVS